MSISDKTKVKYLNQAGLLHQRFTDEHSLEPHDDWDRFNTWMAALYVHLAPSTRRAYHAALDYHQTLHHPEHPTPPVPPGLPNRRHVVAENGERTSAKKSKKIPEPVEEVILNRLENASQRSGASIYNEWAAAFLRAGMAFGLRPVEWRRARLVALEDSSLALHVVNAKQSGARAFGPTRTLVVDEAVVDPREMESAQWLISACYEMTPEQFDSAFENTRRQLHRMNDKCGAPCRTRSGSITLYSARHQFAANAKVAGSTLEELAALMGHASIETAAAHYGRRQYGRGGRKMAVNPHPDDVQRVIDIAQHKAAKKKKPKPSGPG